MINTLSKDPEQSVLRHADTDAIMPLLFRRMFILEPYQKSLRSHLQMKASIRFKWGSIIQHKSLFFTSLTLIIQLPMGMSDTLRGTPKSYLNPMLTERIAQKVTMRPDKIFRSGWEKKQYKNQTAKQKNNLNSERSKFFLHN